MGRRASIAQAVAAPAAGLARMLGAAAADVTGIVDPRRREAVDPLGLRDPEYIRRTLPALRAMADVYFRAEVRELENIPAQGPVLLVGNHSGGTLIADTFVFAQAFYDHFGADRVFHQLAHDLVFKVPGRARRAHAVRNGARLTGEHAAGARAGRRAARVSRR